MLRCVLKAGALARRPPPLVPEPSLNRFALALLLTPIPLVPLVPLFSLAFGAPTARAEDTPGAPAAPAEEPAFTIPAPAGMVWVDTSAAKIEIGTSAEEVFKLTEKRSPEAKLELSYEAPRHEVTIQPYFLDKYEVTNAQYLHYLDAEKKTTFKTGAGGFSNLDEISSFYAYGGKTVAEEKGDKWPWSQLYELNKAALKAALPELKSKDDFRFSALPEDVVLTVYRARLPRLWFTDGDKLEGDAAPDHPVRDISYLEAEAFAEWAGKHLPSEQEWEWAARGPERLDHPWGNEWRDGVDEATQKRVVESRCVWNDSAPKSKKTFEPITVPAASMPEGASWCGAHHLLGNVAEWTSSWFVPYPGWSGSSDVTKNFWAAYHGDFVRVIRGAGCGDREQLALRASYRNFKGVERKAPPRPENHFDYTGFRLAQYLTPGKDRLDPAVGRLLKPKKVRREQVEVRRFAGAATSGIVRDPSAVENGVYVAKRASSVLVAPLGRLSWDDKEKPVVRTPEALKAYTENAAENRDALPVAVFHTDLTLSKVALLDKAAAAAAAAESAGKRRGERGKKETGLPATKEGDLVGDTYILGISHGHIGVYRANLDFVAYLGKPVVTAMKLKKGEAPPAATLDVDPDADLVKVSFWIAYGGKGMEAEDGVKLEFSITTATGDAEKAGSWRAGSAADEKQVPASPPAKPAKKGDKPG